MLRGISLMLVVGFASFGASAQELDSPYRSSYGGNLTVGELNRSLKVIRKDLLKDGETKGQILGHVYSLEEAQATIDLSELVQANIKQVSEERHEELFSAGHSWCSLKTRYSVASLFTISSLVTTDCGNISGYGGSSASRGFEFRQYCSVYQQDDNSESPLEIHCSCEGRYIGSRYGRRVLGTGNDTHYSTSWTECSSSSITSLRGKGIR